MTMEYQISADEAALYDRQIRLWGLGGQQKLRSSSTLLCGDLKSNLAIETLKNLALAGVGSITLLSQQKIDGCEQSISTFVLSGVDGQDRKHEFIAEYLQDYLNELNHRVKCNVITDGADTLIYDAQFVAQFSVIVLIGATNWSQLVRLDNVTRPLNVALYSACTLGDYGWILNDLGSKEHQYYTTSKQLKQDQEAVQMNTNHSTQWPSLEQLLNFQLPSQTVPLSAKKVSRVVSPLFCAFQILFQNVQGVDDVASNLCDLNESKCKEFIEQYVKAKNLPESYINADLLLSIKNSVERDEPTTGAILGGILAQDLLRLLSGKDCPIRNAFVFDANASSGIVHFLN
ncbi:hypothetical protein MP228_012813 [Amoeboaphelidium protococcarum]|nr:hypothetical protein MP228_012813 [Amoeboaphelidium protococcarum]